MTMSFIIPTIGRASLKKTLDSIHERPGAGETAVRDIPPTHMWGNNLHTLINAVRMRMERGEIFRIPNIYRYIVDKEEFQHWTNPIPNWNCEMNIVGRRMKAADIVREFA